MNQTWVALLSAALVAVYLAGAIPWGMPGTLLTLAIALGFVLDEPGTRKHASGPRRDRRERLRQFAQSFEHRL